MKKIISLVVIIALVFSALPMNSIAVYAVEKSDVVSRGKIVDLEKIKESVSDTEDTDNDGLSDTIERILDTDVEKSDTDGDGLFDLFEIENKLDPSNRDTNNDGLDDLYEITGGSSDIEITSELVNRDTDNDGIANVYDTDNDNDGVLDKIDISPFSFIEDAEEYALNVTTSGKSTIVTIQLQPSDIEKLYENNKIISWPTDNEGSIRNYDGKEGGVTVTPMLEVSMDSYPDEETRRKYGYVLTDGKLLIPLERIEQDGTFVVLQGTIFIPSKAGRKISDSKYEVEISFKLKWSVLVSNDNVNSDFNKIGLLYFNDEIVKVEDIKASFDPFYTATTLSGATDVNVLHELKDSLDDVGVYEWGEVENFIN